MKKPIQKPVIVVEPGVIALPLYDGAISEKSKREWASQLSHWLDVATENDWIKWATHQPALVLLDENKIPSLRAPGGRVWSPNDVLASLRVFEDLRLCLFDGYVELGGVKPDRTDLFPYSDELNGHVGMMVRIIAKYAENQQDVLNLIRVACHNKPQTSIRLWKKGPKIGMILVSNWDEFLNKIDPHLVFKLGLKWHDRRAIIAALRIEMRSILRQLEVKSGWPYGHRWDYDLPGFGIGPDFVRSVHDMHLTEYDEKLVLEGCSEAILKITEKYYFEMKDRPFNVSQSEKMQKTRKADGASGWRINVQRHMFRINYWHIEGSSGPPELAVMERHRVNADGTVPTDLKDYDPNQAEFFIPKRMVRKLQRG